MECRSGWPGALGRAGAPPMRSTGAVSQAGSWLLSGISFQRFINPSDREASRRQVLPCSDKPPREAEAGVPPCTHSLLPTSG